MPDTTPAPDAPPPSRVPSKPPAPPAPVAVQVIDRLGEIVYVLAAAYLCRAGKLSGEVFVISSLAALGVQNGLRSFARGRNGGAGVGAVGLALMALGPAMLRTLGVVCIALLAVGLVAAAT